MKNAVQNIKAFYTPGSLQTPSKTNGKGNAKMFYISKVQFDRMRFDIQLWREACNEMESAWYPHRVKVQRMYLDTVLNEHTKSCIRKRKRLTLQRKYKLCDENGNMDEVATKLLKKTWFNKFQSYSLDAMLYGYNLIFLGSVENDAYPNLDFVKRQNVSPDRKVVSSLVYMPTGDSWESPEYKEWYVYVSTPNETGASPCGYGILYELAKTEILLRNNTGQNADYNETHGQPIRKGRTSKTGPERDDFENALRSVGSNAYILLDEGSDDVDLIESKGAGSAWQTYQDFEKRGEAKISKSLLGHADALDSVPGKLGNDSEDSPAEKALLSIQSEDAEFMEPIINEQLLPRMRSHGFKIGDHLHFEYLNDDEKERFRTRQDKSNKTTAEIAETMGKAGLQMDAKYFEERTGIPTTKKETTFPDPTPDQKLNAIKNGTPPKTKQS